MQRAGIFSRYIVDRVSRKTVAETRPLTTALTCTRCPLARGVIFTGSSLRRHAHTPSATSSPSAASSRRPLAQPRLFVRRGAFSPESTEPDSVISNKPRRAALPTRTSGGEEFVGGVSDNRSTIKRTPLPIRESDSRSESSGKMAMTPQTPNPARDGALNHPSRHLGCLTALDHLPPMPVLVSTGKKRVVSMPLSAVGRPLTMQVGWSRGDHAQLLPALHGARSLTINTPYGQLRATPANSLPLPKVPPFPPQFIRERALDKLVTLMIVATKAKISKLATKRNKSVRDLHVAVDLVVNRGAGLGQEEDGWDLVSTGE